MKKRNLKTLSLSKQSISNLDKAVKGGARTIAGSGSQNDSKCGYSCDPNLCGSVEPWGC
jgi:indole-3-glycerol phosphate synthase